MAVKVGQIYVNSNCEDQYFIVTKQGLGSTFSCLFVDGSVCQRKSVLISKSELVAEYPNYMSAILSEEWKNNCEKWEQSAIEPDPQSLKEIIRSVEKKLSFENSLREFDKLEEEFKI